MFCLLFTVLFEPSTMITSCNRPCQRTTRTPFNSVELFGLNSSWPIHGLSGCLCILELFLITALVKLQEIREGQTVNFEMVYSEYAKFCRSNCPGYLYDKAVVYKLLDNLIDLELVVTGKAAVSAAATTVDSRNVMTGATSLPNYRPLFCFVDTSVLSACLDAYPNCPVELRFWIHSRTF
ncbi:hypothetical protein AHF37_02521 [Paragonimus kellicotti]|nr:hypothetical protein AHF37_02521 [Paragonimus kellicotti]